ncbi:MAG: hypothetical protein E7374_00935 [Clostridiales bacterium]|nr:hypothetical protein [Clostridiales bacterium]
MLSKENLEELLTMSDEEFARKTSNTPKVKHKEEKEVIKSKSPQFSKNIHFAHRERMRDKYLDTGFENMLEHEKIEMFLFFLLPRKNTNEIAHVIKERFGNLNNFLNARPADILEVTGLGKNSLVGIDFLKKVSSSYHLNKDVGITVDLSTSKNFIDYIKSKHIVGDNEEFFCFCMNAYYKFIKEFKITSEHSEFIEISKRSFIKKVADPDIKHVVIIHTHPKGSVKPSRMDLKSTLNLIEACSSIGIDVYDHFILSRTESFSMRNEKILDHLKNNDLVRAKELLGYFD